jgi:hypothetical protein
LLAVISDDDSASAAPVAHVHVVELSTGELRGAGAVERERLEAGRACRHEYQALFGIGRVDPERDVVAVVLRTARVSAITAISAAAAATGDAAGGSCFAPQEARSAPADQQGNRTAVGHTAVSVWNFHSIVL